MPINTGIHIYYKTIRIIIAVRIWLQMNLKNNFTNKTCMLDSSHDLSISLKSWSALEQFQKKY